MNEITPPPEYIRYCTRLAMQGSGFSPLLSASEPETESSNVSDIRAARTMKAVEICRKRGWA
jgi:hypothetical protein